MLEEGGGGGKDDDGGRGGRVASRFAPNANNGGPSLPTAPTRPPSRQGRPHESPASVSRSVRPGRNLLLSSHTTCLLRAPPLSFQQSMTAEAICMWSNLLMPRTFVCGNTKREMIHPCVTVDPSILCESTAVPTTGLAFLTRTACEPLHQSSFVRLSRTMMMMMMMTKMFLLSTIDRLLTDWSSVAASTATEAIHGSKIRRRLVSGRQSDQPSITTSTATIVARSEKRKDVAGTSLTTTLFSPATTTAETRSASLRPTR
jgi:hypothetical protein